MRRGSQPIADHREPIYVDCSQQPDDSKSPDPGCSIGQVGLEEEIDPRLAGRDAGRLLRPDITDNIESADQEDGDEVWDPEFHGRSEF